MSEPTSTGPRGRCPHCGEKLPWIVDVFCQGCGNALDEPPAEPPAEGRVHPPGAREEARAGGTMGLLLVVCGLGGLFGAFLSAVGRNWFEAAYAGVPGVTMVVAGLVMIRRPGAPGK